MDAVFSAIDWKTRKRITGLIFNTLNCCWLVVWKSTFILREIGKNQRGMSSWGRNTAARGRELFIDTISDGTADCTWKMQRHRFYINNIYMLYVSSAEITVWRIPNITTEPLEKTIKCSLYKCARSRTTGN